MGKFFYTGTATERADFWLTTIVGLLKMTGSLLEGGVTSPAYKSRQEEL